MILVNLVTDGTFDEATSTTWYGNAYNPVDGVNQADVGAAGNPWDVNLSGYVNVTAGTDYTLSFDVVVLTVQSLQVSVSLLLLTWVILTQLR